MSQIAVRLTNRELGMLDSAVTAGGFASRAEAVRAGLRLLERDLREARIAASYRAAYATPLTEEERAVLDGALALAGDAATLDAALAPPAPDADTDTGADAKP